MRWSAAFLVFLTLAGPRAFAAEVKATSRIETVTVYPSGAEITRIGRVKLEQGEHAVLFGDLPAQAVAGSIRVEGKASGRLDIGSVDVRQVYVPQSDEATAATERKRIEDEIQKLTDDKSALQAEVQAAEAQKALIGNLAQLPVHPAPQGASAGAAPDWSQIYGLIGQRMVEAQKAALEAQIKIRDLDRQIKDLQGKLASLAPAPQQRTEVKVFLAAGAALDADIVIRYQVRSATWTPLYDARLATGTKAHPPRLQIVRRATIRQRSGETWNDVALVLSTARPAAGTSAPVLHTVTVDYQPEIQPDKVAAAPPPAPRYQLERQAVRGRAGPVKEKDEEALSVAAQEAQAAVEAQAFQAVYSIAGRVSVPATGEQKGVRIDEMEIDPVLTLRTVPKREQKAYLYAKLAVPRGTPLLPGQVSLFRDSTFVGNGHLPLLAPGETHELGFGVDDAVRVRHAIAEEKRSEGGIITTSKTDVRNYRVTLKNLHERAMQVTVLDQVPVSQNADIKVEPTGKVPPTKRDVDDKRGVFAWELKLEPDEERVLEFGYRVTWPGSKNIIYHN
ncbi:MAG TPA: mucoidy inhibitor MuiA family protein [Hyphomicrobiaceae bacterium]|nr:mucoidy inhibitor MuiA family protein [Hyphomicrobiaceae bacterium]